MTHGLKCEWGTNKACEQGAGSEKALRRETVTENKDPLLMNMKAPARIGICSMYCVQQSVDVCSKMLTWESCGTNICTKHTFDSKTFVNDVVPGTFSTRNSRVWKDGPVDLSDNNIACSVSYYANSLQTKYTIRSTRVTVVAPPRECGDGFQIPVVSEGDDTNVKLQLCGNPAPTVSWSTTIPGVTPTTKNSGAQVDGKFYNLTYDFTDSPFKAKPSMCNHVVRYRATNKKGETRDGSGKLKVLFDIERVTGVKVLEQLDRSTNKTCVTVNWNHSNAGFCKVRYEIQFLDSNLVMQYTEIREATQQNDRKLDLTSCFNQGNAKSIKYVIIRANATKSAKNYWTLGAHLGVGRRGSTPLP